MTFAEEDVRKRSVSGWLFLLVFVVFNAALLVWLGVILADWSGW